MIAPLTPGSPLLAANAALLDVREAAAFAAGHLAGSGHVPLAELEARRAELPARDRPIVVVAADGAAAAAGARELERLGYQEVHFLDAPLAAIAGGRAGRGAPARLWRPSPFLEQVLPGLTRGRALDLAAGSGREAVFLALHGFAVDAVDRAPEALARAAALAARHGVRIATLVADLERRDARLATGAYALVTVFRFLHRPLFGAIAAALAPGGRLVYETYRRGQEIHGRPTHARFLLRPGELAGAFPGLVVERYEESEPAGGPVMARLLARRPA